VKVGVMMAVYVSGLRLERERERERELDKIE